MANNFFRGEKRSSRVYNLWCVLSSKLKFTLMFCQCDIPVCILYIPFYITLNKFSDYTLQYRCIQNQFTVQVYTKPVYTLV